MSKTLMVFFHFAGVDLIFWEFLLRSASESIDPQPSRSSKHILGIQRIKRYQKLSKVLFYNLHSTTLESLAVALQARIVHPTISFPSCPWCNCGDLGALGAATTRPQTSLVTSCRMLCSSSFGRTSKNGECSKKKILTARNSTF